VIPSASGDTPAAADGRCAAECDVCCQDEKREERRAREHTTGETAGDAPRDIEYVEIEIQTGPMRAFLEREFGFVFKEP
jgi:hypothetical protein